MAGTTVLFLLNALSALNALLFIEYRPVKVIAVLPGVVGMILSAEGCRVEA